MQRAVVVVVMGIEVPVVEVTRSSEEIVGSVETAGRVVGLVDTAAIYSTMDGCLPWPGSLPSNSLGEGNLGDGIKDYRKRTAKIGVDFYIKDTLGPAILLFITKLYSLWGPPIGLFYRTQISYACCFIA